MRNLTDFDLALLHQVVATGGIFGRDDLLAIRATGPDHLKFLHNMLTQDVKGAVALEARQTCLCDAQGAIVAVAEQLKLDDAVVLWTQRNAAQTLHDSLDRYIIMDDVELQLDEDTAYVSVLGPAAWLLAEHAGCAAVGHAASLTIAGHPALVWLVDRGDLAHVSALTGDAPLTEVAVQLPRASVPTLVALAQRLGAAIGNHAVWDALRLARGVVLMAEDIAGGSLPLEVGLKHSVSYKKGCYVGQEAIAMMTYRGQIRRHQCWLEPFDSGQAAADWCEADWTLRTLDGKKAGTTASAVTWPGGCLSLGLVQRKAYAEGAVLQAVSPDGQTVQVRVVATTVPGALAVQKAAAPDLAQ
jgi:folate-binding protein YgfZ